MGITDLIVGKVIEKLTPLLLEAFTKLGQQLVEKIAALLPVIVAAGVKAFTEQLALKLPDLPSLNLPQVPALAEWISDIGERVFGFDLTDVLFGKRP